MFQVKDHTGNFFEFEAPPQRIISLVPSQTELLYMLGLEERVVGITKFCIHPRHWYKHKNRVGGTKNVKIAEIQSLNPNLVIANKEENVKEQIEEIEKICPVYTTMVDSLSSALQMIHDIGKITFATRRAEGLAKHISNKFEKFQPMRRYRTLYLIWKDPYMSVGGDTFINNMMQYAGFDNLLTEQTRYPTIDAEQIKQLQPEVILLSSEPYPFKRKHIQEFQALCPAAKVLTVQGDLFSWYGSRLLLSVKYFEKLQRKIARVNVD
ncbi:MAG: ABC transporter substrate-binding protein [Bacteroidetes bacterium]|nr:ABC transporter substrate-binding protein [Bacteroidota bacterium]